MNVPSLVCKARGLGICDLPADLLILMLSPLHGQDIARCNMVSRSVLPSGSNNLTSRKQVCRHFSTLIRSDLSLQYKIELVQNGMIDGQSSTLPMSERLQRLREYASRFRNGIFDHEDLTAHEEYADSFLNNPNWTFLEVSSHENSLSTLYVRGPHDSPLRKPHRLILSAFTPGSAQAGIQSSRCLLPIDGPHPGPQAEACPRWIYKWAIDGAQDLLVMAEGEQNIDMPEQLEQWCVLCVAHGMADLTSVQAGRVSDFFLFLQRLEDRRADASSGRNVIRGAHLRRAGGDAERRLVKGDNIRLAYRRGVRDLGAGRHAR